jgi:acyl carrier protein
MEEAAIYEKLGGVFADVFLRDDIALTPALSAKDVAGWDSFKQIEIVTTCEEIFGMQFSTRDLDAMQNVGDLVAVIKKKTTG